MAAHCPTGYTQAMQNLDKDRPARIRQEAADRVAKAQRECRRSVYWPVVAALLIGLVVGFAAGLLAAEGWYAGREMIFIPTDGTEV